MEPADELLARARAALPEAAYRTGDYDSVEALLIGALRLAESASDRRSEAGALDMLGVLRHWRTLDRPREEWPGIDHGLEQDLFERALAIRRELGDTAGVAESLLHAGWVLQVLRDDSEAAIPLFREALALVEPEGDPEVRSEIHRHIGFHVALTEHRAHEALPHFRTSLELWRTGPEPARVVAGLVALARCESMAGRHDDALAHSREALDLARQGGFGPRVVGGAEAARQVVEEAAGGTA